MRINIFRLLSKYQPTSENHCTVAAKVFAEYKLFGGTLNAATFGIVVNKVFTSLNRISKYEGHKKIYMYNGLKELDKENEECLSHTSMLTYAPTIGFQGSVNAKGVVFHHVSNYICNGQSSLPVN